MTGRTVIDTPCCVRKLERSLLHIASLGGWDSTRVSVEGDKIVIEYEDGSNEWN